MGIRLVGAGGGGSVAGTAVLVGPSTAANNTILPVADVVPLTLKAKVVGFTQNLMEMFDSSGSRQVAFNGSGNLLTLSESAASSTLQIGSISGGVGIQWPDTMKIQRQAANRLDFVGRTFKFDGQLAGATPVIVEHAATPTEPFQVWQGSTGTVFFAIDEAGFPRWTDSSTQQTTVGAAGGASPLPATPTKYLKVKDSADATLVIPAYAAA